MMSECKILPDEMTANYVPGMPEVKEKLGWSCTIIVTFNTVLNIILWHIFFTSFDI